MQHNSICMCHEWYLPSLRELLVSSGAAAACVRMLRTVLLNHIFFLVCHVCHGHHIKLINLTGICQQACKNMQCIRCDHYAWSCSNACRVEFHNECTIQQHEATVGNLTQVINCSAWNSSWGLMHVIDCSIWSLSWGLQGPGLGDQAVQYICPCSRSLVLCQSHW